MPQILKGTTYSAINNQVNFTNLNNLVDASILLVGAVSEQSAMTANTVAASDEFLINDGGVLKKTTASDILNSGLNASLGVAQATSVTTNAINTLTGDDLQLTATDKAIVTGKAFSSGDGISVTVFSTAHGLLANAIVLVSASVAEYSGTFRIASVATDSFVYVLNTTATPTSGTCSYTKKASVNVNGGFVSNSLSVSKGDHRVDGVLYAEGAIQADGAFTSNGVANFTGTLQVNGIVGYVLTEVLDETIPPYTSSTTGNISAIWQSLLFTKPAGEVWVFELNFNHGSNITSQIVTPINYAFGIRYASSTVYTGSYKSTYALYRPIGGASHAETAVIPAQITWVEQSATVLTNEKVVVDVFVGTAMKMFSNSSAIFTGFTTPVASSVLRIYKFKTA
jgi:hypothetical protein